MGKLHTAKTSFVAGELDPLLLSRSDIKHYYNAGKRVRNAIVIPEGGVSMRPGSEYLHSFAGTGNVRLAEFQFNTEQTYLIAFTDLLITIFRDGVQVATVVSPYTSADLVPEETAEGDLVSSGIYWTQDKDTLLIFHQDHEVQRLQRTGSHSSWSLSAYTLKNVPRYDFGLTYTDPAEVGVDEIQTLQFPAPGSQGDWTNNDTFSLLLEGEESANISYSATPATLATRMQDALRAMPNTSAAGITVTSSGSPTSSATFTVTFAGDDGDRPWGQLYYKVVSAEQVPSIDILITTDGQYPGEPVFSATRGYPRCGVFFQGRLWVAGTIDLPHWVWSSRSGAYDDFNSKLLADDYSCNGPADAADVPAFTAIYAGRHLQFFSRSGEFYVPASDQQAVTPSNFALRRTTSRGNKPGLRVVEVDGATHFVQRRGKALREFIYADAEQAYTAANISLLSPHLMRDPVDLALRRSTSTSDADYEFMPNSDGTMTVFCTLRRQEVNAMTLWVTTGSFKAVAVVLDTVYFAILRTINGTDVLTLERMDETMTVDCGLKGSAASSAALAHLPSTDIEHLLDGSIQLPITADGSGNITFARAAATDWQAGLKFAEPDSEHPGLIWFVETLPVELDLPQGTTFGKKRRISNVTIRLHETSALVVQSNRISFQSFGSGLLDTKVDPFTGVKKVGSLLGWNYDGTVVIGGDQSLPATVLGLSFAVGI